MKKFLVWLLVLIMVLNCSAVFADEVPDMEFEMTIHMDPDNPYVDSAMGEFYESFGYDIQALEQAQMDVERRTADLLNLVSGHMLYADEQLNLSMNLKGKPILTLDAGFNDEGEFLMNSSVFPSYTIAYTAEELAANDAENARLMEALKGMVLPLVQIYTDCLAAIDPYITAVEDGPFEMNGHSYDQRTTIRMTGEECWAIVQHVQAQLIPLMEKLLVAYGVEEDPEAMLASVEDAQSQEVPAYLAGDTVSVQRYTSRENPMLVHVDVAFENEGYSLYAEMDVEENHAKLHLMTGSGTDTYADKAAMEKAAAEGAVDVWRNNKISLALDEENRQILLTLEDASYHYARHEVCMKDGESEIEVTYKGYLQEDGNPLVEVALKGWVTDRKTEPVTADGKTIVNCGDLIRAGENYSLGGEYVTEQDYALISGINNDVTKAGNRLAIQIILAAPEEVQALMEAETALTNAYIYTYTETRTPIELPDEGTSF